MGGVARNLVERYEGPWRGLYAVADAVHTQGPRVAIGVVGFQTGPWPGPQGVAEPRLSLPGDPSHPSDPAGFVC